MINHIISIYQNKKIIFYCFLISIWQKTRTPSLQDKISISKKKTREVNQKISFHFSFLFLFIVVSSFINFKLNLFKKRFVFILFCILFSIFCIEKNHNHSVSVSLSISNSDSEHVREL